MKKTIILTGLLCANISTLPFLGFGKKQSAPVAAVKKIENARASFIIDPLFSKKNQSQFLYQASPIAAALGTLSLSKRTYFNNPKSLPRKAMLGFGVACYGIAALSGFANEWTSKMIKPLIQQ